jgi:hypothetical protein
MHWLGMSMVGDMFNTQLKAKLDALCTDIAAHLEASEAAAGTRSAADQIGGLSDWAGRALLARRMIFDTPFFPMPAGWLSTTAAPSRSTTPAITRFSASHRPKAATKPSRSQARTDWPGSPTCRSLPADGCSGPRAAPGRKSDPEGKTTRNAGFAIQGRCGGV